MRVRSIAVPSQGPEVRPFVLARLAQVRRTYDPEAKKHSMDTSPARLPRASQATIFSPGAALIRL
jgi:hypothetical protein